MESFQKSLIDEKTVRPRSYSLSSVQNTENTIDFDSYKNSVPRTYSDLSVELSSHSDEEFKAGDSGICDGMSDGDMLVVLEQKIDRLSDMFQEQCKLLNTMKVEIRNSKMLIRKTEEAHDNILINMLKNAVSQRVKELNMMGREPDEAEGMNSRAKSLLEAIESRKKVFLDGEIRDSLLHFLQSEELKDQMVRATAESVRGMIDGCFNRDMSALYLPVLEKSHRRLIEHIHRVIQHAFVELEDKSSSLFKSVHKTSGAIRRALERHQSLLDAISDPNQNIISTLQCTVEELLKNELKDWRQKVLNLFSTQFHCETNNNNINESVPPINCVPVTTPQSKHFDTTMIEKLMITARITQQVQSGDVNGTFERALCASDLSQVMTACRAADPQVVFKPPCQLQQHVLLSLLQQLATDMVKETNLKCRYLEGAIINLNISNAHTRQHLPLVVGEVRKHLYLFLMKNPNHEAQGRITMIILAANNLLK